MSSKGVHRLTNITRYRGTSTGNGTGGGPTAPTISMDALGTVFATASTTLSAAYPATHANDIMFLQVGASNTASATITTPSGWALVNSSVDSTTGAGQWVFWKQATGTESGSLAVTTSSATPLWRGLISSWTGIQLSPTPYTNTLSGVFMPSGTAFSTTSMSVDTTSISGNRYVLLFGRPSTGTTAWSVEAVSGISGGTATEEVDNSGTLLAYFTGNNGSSAIVTATLAASAVVAYVMCDLVEV